jgi:hypothetical protein
MQRARSIAGLTVNKKQGGGNKKQGQPTTDGININSMSIVKKQATQCKCVVLPMVMS